MMQIINNRAKCDPIRNIQYRNWIIMGFIEMIDGGYNVMYALETMYDLMGVAYVDHMLTRHTNIL